MAFSGKPVPLLFNASTTGFGPRFKCSVNLGSGEVAQACTTFYVDISLTGSPASYNIDLYYGINEQNINQHVTNAIVTAIGTSRIQLPVPTIPTGNTAPLAATWWQLNLTGMTGGTSPTVTAYGISATQ